MATAILSLSRQTGYQHHGQSTPINTLTRNTQLLLLAGRLAQQGREMDQAHLADRHFDYHPVPISQKFKHIFF